MNQNSGRLPGVVRMLAAALMVALVGLTVGLSTQQTVVAAKPPAPPAKCTDPSVTVTIVPTTGGVLTGDSAGAIYTDGVSGVYNTVIHICSGTYDATMGLITSQRSLLFAFPQPEPNSSFSGIVPAWVGTTIRAKPFMNVRNILWGRMNHQPTFTTHMGFSYLKGTGDKSDYRIQYFGDGANGMADDTSGDLNWPAMTAVATVQDIPGTCRTQTGGTFDSWIVTVNNGASKTLGTLHKMVNSGSEIQEGQYNMPFQLKIEARSCLPF